MCLHVACCALAGLVVLACSLALQAKLRSFGAAAIGLAILTALIARFSIYICILRLIAYMFLDIAYMFLNIAYIGGELDGAHAS